MSRLLLLAAIISCSPSPSLVRIQLQQALTLSADAYLSLQCGDAAPLQFGPQEVNADTRELSFTVEPCADARLGLWFQAENAYVLAGTARTAIEPRTVADVTFAARVLGNLTVTGTCELRINSGPQNPVLVEASVRFPRRVVFNAPSSFALAGSETFAITAGEYSVACGNAEAKVNVPPTGFAMLSFAAPAFDAARSGVIAVGPTTRFVGQQGDFDVQILDASGLPVPGVQAVVMGDASITQPGLTDAMGRARGHLNPTSRGQYTVSAAVNGVALAESLTFTYQTDTQRFADPAQSQVHMTRREARADNVDAVTFAVAVRNPSGGPVPNAVLSHTCTPSCPAGITVTADMAAGVYSYTVRHSAVLSTVFSFNAQGPEGPPVALQQQALVRFLAPGMLSLDMSTLRFASYSTVPPLANGYDGATFSFEARDIDGLTPSGTIEIAAAPLPGVAISPTDGCSVSACAAFAACAQYVQGETDFELDTTQPGVRALSLTVCADGEVLAFPVQPFVAFEPALQVYEMGNRPNVSVTPDGNYWVFASDSYFGADAPTGWLPGVMQVWRYDVRNDEMLAITCHDGLCGSSNSDFPVISSDGNWIAYESNASLQSLGAVGPPGPAGGSGPMMKVYAHDVQTRTTYLASVRPGFVEPEGTSAQPSIAVVNGEVRVAFKSDDNLGGNETDSDVSVFLWRRSGLAASTGTLWPVHVNLSLVDVHEPVLSPDGSRVAFATAADANALNPTLTEASFSGNVYVALVPVNPGPIDAPLLISHAQSNVTTTANGISRAPSFGPDGALYFESYASDLTSPVATTGWLYKSVDNTVTRMPIPLSGDCIQGDVGVGDVTSRCVAPSLSSDGRYIAYQSGALGAWTTPAFYGGATLAAGTQPQMLLMDTQRGISSWLSRSSTSPSQGCSGACRPHIDADGARVTFAANNLVATRSGVMHAGNPFLEMSPVQVSAMTVVPGEPIAIAQGGRYIAFMTNDVVASEPGPHVVVLDRFSGFHSVVSAGLGGDYHAPSISEDGELVTFTAGSSIQMRDRFGRHIAQANLDAADGVIAGPCHSSAALNGSYYYAAFICNGVAYVRAQSKQVGEVPSNTSTVSQVGEVALNVAIERNDFYVFAVYATPQALLVAQMSADVGSAIWGTLSIDASSAPAPGAYSDIHLSSGNTSAAPYVSFTTDAELTGQSRPGLDTFVRQLQLPIAHADVLLASTDNAGQPAPGTAAYRAAGITADGRMVGLLGPTPMLRDMYGPDPLRLHGAIADFATPNVTHLRVGSDGRHVLMVAGGRLFVARSPWSSERQATVSNP